MTGADTDFFEQLRLAKQRVVQTPEDWRTWDALYVTWARVGAVSRAVQALKRSVALAPPSANIHARAIGFYVGTRDHEIALKTARALLKQNPTDTSHLILGLRCGLACGAVDLVGEWARALAHHDPEQTALAGHALSRIGEYSSAEELLKQRCLDAPDDALALSVLAELQLWSSHHAHAAATAGQALALMPSLPLAELVQAACLLRSGQDQMALAQLQRLSKEHGGPSKDIRLVEHSTLLGWTSLALHATGDLNGAARMADKAMHASGPQSLPARLLRMKMVTLQGIQRTAERRKEQVGEPPDPLKDQIDIWAYRELLVQIAPLLHTPEEPWTGVAGDLQQAMDHALTELGDNLTPSPSRRCSGDGSLVPFQPPPAPRHAARHLQHLLRTRPASEVLARFEELQAEHPHSVTPLTYMGEVLLWMGRTSQARVQLQAAIDKDIATQWAWIGLGACDLLDGHPEQAIALFAEGIEMCRFEGPTMYVYRSECWLATGELERALQDINAALYSKPQRISAWLIRARVDLAMGQDGLAQALMAQLKLECPLLWQTMGSSGDDLDQAMAAGLTAMRGNRSSSLPFFFPASDAPLAFVRWHRKSCTPLFEHIDPLESPPPFRWVESRPAMCRLGDCGPRCVARKQIQGWLGPAVAINHRVHLSTAPDALKAQAKDTLTYLQAQRRRGCPDLDVLGQRVSTLLLAIPEQVPGDAGLNRLCELLEKQLRQ